MSGSVSEDSGSGRFGDSMSSSQRCPSDESLSERLCEQVPNGVASTTSPAFWDTDDDDDSGPKPSELFGKFTWKIENFSQISKRELRSNAFEVGGYKWYILVYPQGCDVCNHLSLFLCVANHEKLLPGWSHFAQFTIAVVNKDPKKSKYSDTLHRFWKKEHDWGWKKFMELSKIYDGFVVSDMLVIKAQVQVIREKVYRPFRCLDCVYRRELIRVYLTNVEGICRRFIEERRSRLGKLIEDKARWASFRTFWEGVDQTGRRSMSNEKCDSILKVVVKHFFIEKEVTSTLVMDSLYSGLRALECQSSNKKLKDKAAEVEDIPPPIVRVEKDTFVLADDVLQLLEKAVGEPLPPSKDDKGPQNRTKEGTSGEDFNKDSVERDEKRLTELGRRTVEIFVVTHIFSNRIEVAYQEAVALKRQEELIREEEAAVLAETDQKSKRGAAEKDKRKKKQAKQKKNKKKEKGRDDKSTFQKDKHLKHRFLDDPSLDEPPMKDDLFADKGDDQEGDISDVSDTGEDMSENLQPDVEERDAGPINWDTDASEVHPAPEVSGSEVMNGDTAINERAIRKNQSAMDDSSSTSSYDSVPSVVMNGGADKGLSIQSNQTSPSRGRNNQEKENREQNSCHEADALSVGASSDTNISYDTETGNQDTRVEVDPVSPSKNEPQWVEQRPAEKETEISSPIRKLTIKDVTQPDRTLKPSGERPAEASSSPSSSQPAIKKGKSATTREEIGSLTLEAVPSGPALVSSPSEKTFSLLTRSPRTPPLTPHVEPQRPKTAGKVSGVRLDHSQSMRSTLMETDSYAPLSRPSSAPIISVPRPSSAVISSVHSSPVHSSQSLARSSSATGRLGINADQPIASSSGSASSSYVVHNQSYRNAMMNSRGRSSSSPSYSSVSHSIPNVVPVYPPPVPSTLPLYSPPSPALSQNSSVMDGGCSVGKIECPGFTFGTVTPEILPQPQSESLQEETSSLLWINKGLQQQDERSGLLLEPYQRRDMVRADFIPNGTHAAAGVAEEDFPHLDIINYLLDEEQNPGRDASTNDLPHIIGHHLLNGAGQYAYQGMISNRLEEVGMLELAASSSCRYERSLMYSDDGFQHIYGGASSISSYEILRDGQDASSIMPYALQHNGQTSGMFSPSNRSGHRQWSARSSSDNVSLLRNSESDPSLYLMMPSDYSEMVNGGRLNGGYSVYGPANGN